jgi:hypothetical protein
MSTHPLQSSGTITVHDILLELGLSNQPATLYNLANDDPVYLNRLDPNFSTISGGPPWKLSDWYGYNHLYSTTTTTAATTTTTTTVAITTTTTTTIKYRVATYSCPCSALGYVVYDSTISLSISSYYYSPSELFVYYIASTSVGVPVGTLPNDLTDPYGTCEEACPGTTTTTTTSPPTTTTTTTHSILYIEGTRYDCPDCTNGFVGEWWTVQDLSDAGHYRSQFGGPQYDYWINSASGDGHDGELPAVYLFAYSNCFFACGNTTTTTTTGKGTTTTTTESPT